jgi:hypothetical protein
VIPAFDPATGALPPGDHRATLEEIGGRFGFTPDVVGFSRDCEPR